MSASTLENGVEKSLTCLKEAILAGLLENNELELEVEINNTKVVKWL